MEKLITKHEELLKLDGKHVCCILDGIFIEDAIISIENGVVFVCQDIKNGWAARDKKNKKYSWEISNETQKYEVYHRQCDLIKRLDSSDENSEYPQLIEGTFEVLKPMISTVADDTWNKFLETLDGIKNKGSKIKTIKALETLTKKLKEL